MELELRSLEVQGAHEIGGCALGRGTPPVSWAPCSSADLNSNPIYSVSRRKKSERKFHCVLRYGAAAKA